MAVTTYAKNKFEPKVMLWIAMSRKGLTTPVLTSGRNMAVNARYYVDNCLEPHLITFLDTYYHGSIFWLDEASAHNARVTTDFLDSKSVNYVRKQDNPTEVPQYRPI